MARIVLASSEIAWNMSAHIECGRRLEAHGHTVVLAVQHDHPVDAGDLTVLRLPGHGFFHSEPEVAEGRSKLTRYVNTLRTRRTLRSTAAEQVALVDIGDALVDLRPDLVLVDTELHSVVIAARHRELCVAVTTTMVAIHRNRGVPPLHTSSVPGAGLAGTSPAIAARWLGFLVSKRTRRALSWIRRAGTDPLSVLAQATDELGLSFDQLIDRNEWIYPIAHRNVPVVAFFDESFDFPHDPHPLYHHVGSMVREVRIGSDTDSRVDRRVVEMLDRHRTGATQRSLVYCTFGAFFTGDDSTFLAKVVEALGSNDDLDAIVGLGGRLAPAELESTYDNVRLVDWAPQLEVLDVADIAVIHGGMGTTQECIDRGVPMLTYPFPVNDQRGVAARIGFLGLGLVGDRNDSVQTIRQRVAALVADDSIRSTVAAFGRSTDSGEPTSRLEDVVEHLIATR